MLFLLSSLVAPAHAVDIGARYSLGVGTVADTGARVSHAQAVSVGFGPGLPRPELTLADDFSGEASVGSYGVGVRQPIGSRLSVASHVGLLVFSGRQVGYESAFGVDGMVSVDLLDFGDWGGLGVVAMAGVPLTGGSDLWWGMLGTELRFGRKIGDR